MDGPRGNVHKKASQASWRRLGEFVRARVIKREAIALEQAVQTPFYRFGSKPLTMTITAAAGALAAAAVAAMVAAAADMWLAAWPGA